MLFLDYKIERLSLFDYFGETTQNLLDKVIIQQIFAYLTGYTLGKNILQMTPHQFQHIWMNKYYLEREGPEIQVVGLYYQKGDAIVKGLASWN